MKDDELYLRHILECIRRIEEDTLPGWEKFSESHTLQDAVLRNLQTMAESTQRLSERLKAAEAGVDWRRIAAFRNVVTHEYLAIEFETVWQIVQSDIPPLKRVVLRMLAAGQAPTGEGVGGR